MSSRPTDRPPEIRVAFSRETRSQYNARLKALQDTRKRSTQSEVESDAKLANNLSKEVENDQLGSSSASSDDHDSTFGSEEEESTTSRLASSSMKTKTKKRKRHPNPAIVVANKSKKMGRAQSKKSQKKQRARQKQRHETESIHLNADVGGSVLTTSTPNDQTCIKSREGELSENESNPEDIIRATPMPHLCNGEFAKGLQRYFNSWSEFEQVFHKFMFERFQLFRKRTSTSVKSRIRQQHKRMAVSQPNDDIDDGESKSVSEDDRTEIPLEWGRYAATYVCINGFKPQRTDKKVLHSVVPEGNASESAADTVVDTAGTRERRFYRYTGCAAKVNATVSRVNAKKRQETVRESGWAITWRAVGGHNHDVSASLFQQYKEVRLPYNPELARDVDRMLRTGSDVHGNLRTLRAETGMPILRKDVHNLIARVKRDRVAGTTVEDRLNNTFDTYTATQGNWGRVFVDPRTKETQSVVWQSGRMRRWFAACPEVMMVDCTHGTNKNKFLLFSFLIHDIFGKGQYVNHALLHRETMDNMEDAIAMFQKHNAGCDDVRAIIVDKDFRERSLLKRYFPRARILLCHYHVIKVFAKQVKKLVRGTGDEKDEIVGILRAMVYAKSRPTYEALKLLLAKALGSDTESEDEEYDKERDGDTCGPLVDEEEEVASSLLEDGEELESIAELAFRAPDDGRAASGRRHRLYKYFLDNWDEIQIEWVLYHRQNVAHLGNNTNNSIEAKWGAMKRVVRAGMDMEETIRAINELQEIDEDEYIEALTKIGTKVHKGDDVELNQLIHSVSGHAFDLVSAEYNFVQSGKARYTVRESNGNAILQSTENETGSEHTINIETFRCSCFFAQVRLLPCRHVFFFRKLKAYESIIPFKHITMRWSVRNPKNNIKSGELLPGSYQITDARTTRVQDLRQQDKYNRALSLTKPICGILALKNADMFDKLMHALETFKSLLDAGEVPRISRSDQNEFGDSVHSIDRATNCSGRFAATPEATSIPAVAPKSCQNERGTNRTEFTQPGCISIRTARNRMASAERQKLYDKIRKQAMQYVATEAIDVKHLSLADAHAALETSWYSYRTVLPLICGIPIYRTSAESMIILKRDEHVIVDSTTVRYILEDHVVTKLLEDVNDVYDEFDEEAGAMHVVLVGEGMGCLSLSQLRTMHQYAKAVDQVYAVTVAIEWLTRTKMDCSRLPFPFNNLTFTADENLVNDAIAACEMMPLGLVKAPLLDVRGAEIIQRIASDMWLNTMAVNAIISCICSVHEHVGVILPDFITFKDSRREKVMLEMDPFQYGNKRVISVVNLGGVHWQAFILDLETRICTLFDPLGTATRASRLQDLEKKWFAKMC